MDQLHSEMRISQSYPDDKHRTESSSTESSEMAPPIIPRYLFQLSYPHQIEDTDYSRTSYHRYLPWSENRTFFSSG
jgi:hypothetical protein